MGVSLNGPFWGRIENPENQDSGFEGVWGSMLKDNSKNGKCHKLRTYILIDMSLVSQKGDFPNKRKVFLVMMFRFSGNVETS